jgi:hypothetical protein
MDPAPLDGPKSARLIDINEEKIRAEFPRRGRDAWISWDGKHKIRAQERESAWRDYSAVVYEGPSPKLTNDWPVGTLAVEDGDRPNAISSKGFIFGATYQVDAEKYAWLWTHGCARQEALRLQPLLVDAYKRKIAALTLNFPISESLVFALSSDLNYLESIEIAEVIGINESEDALLCKTRNKQTNTIEYARFMIDNL